VLKSDLDAAQATIDELTAELDEKQKELREVSREHEKEENKFKDQRKKMAEKIDKADLERYERIRKAKGGSAVVAVKRESCGGCYHRIPPQKILELRQNVRLFTCEHCGRILVSDEVVSLSADLA
jgi:predicted  nucleic acid-binding Zn-ribbon protein